MFPVWDEGSSGVLTGLGMAWRGAFCALRFIILMMLIDTLLEIFEASKLEEGRNCMILDEYQCYDNAGEGS